MKWNSYLKLYCNNDEAKCDYHGDAYYLLRGIAFTANEIINAYPDYLQQEVRIEFISMLNDAKVGKLYKEKEDETRS